MQRSELDISKISFEEAIDIKQLAGLRHQVLQLFRVSLRYN